MMVSELEPAIGGALARRVEFTKAGEPGFAARAEARLVLAIGAIALGGVGLRVLGARGDIWLDEVWSLRLLEDAHGLGDVFLGIHHLNNHILNSVWLWLVGPGAPFWLMRLPAIVYGGVSILVAAAIGRRHSAAGAVIAAFVFALSYFFVNYGSEARGYSGMILAILAGYWAVLAMFDEDAGAGPYVVFALAVCLGTLSHFTMVEATGALCATVFLISAMRGEPRATILKRSAAVGAIAALASLPALTCLIVWERSGDFDSGIITPFANGQIVLGLARMAGATVGLPPGLDNWTLVGATAALALLALAILPPQRRCFPALVVFGLPLFHWIMQLPVQMLARFHLTVAVGLALVMGEALGALWQKQGLGRLIAIFCLGLFATLQASQLAKFFKIGRGDYASAIEAMTVKGPAAYAVELGFIDPKLDLRTSYVAEYYAKRLGASLTLAKEDAWCAVPPDWLILPFQDSGPLSKAAGPDQCLARYSRDRKFPSGTLSGAVWILYRRDTSAPH